MKTIITFTMMMMSFYSFAADKAETSSKAKPVKAAGKTSKKAAIKAQDEGRAAVPTNFMDCKITPGGLPFDETNHARVSFVPGAGGKLSEMHFYARFPNSQTCSISTERGDANARWSEQGEQTAVVLPSGSGRILIQKTPEGFVFEFINVNRMRHCGMAGTMNGKMTVKSSSSCSVDDTLMLQRTPDQG